MLTHMDLASSHHFLYVYFICMWINSCRYKQNKYFQLTIAQNSPLVHSHSVTKWICWGKHMVLIINNIQIEKKNAAKWPMCKINHLHILQIRFQWPATLYFIRQCRVTLYWPAANWRPRLIVTLGPSLFLTSMLNSRRPVSVYTPFVTEKWISSVVDPCVSGVYTSNSSRMSW